MLVLIVATEIQLFLNENHVRVPPRSGCTQRHLAIILNAELPDLPLIVPYIIDVTQQSLTTRQQL